MKKLNQKNMLSAAVSSLVTLAICQSASLQASDIEIYSNSTGGKTSILLMLDTSGSMGISSLVLPKTNTYGSPGDVDVALCDRVDVSEFHNDGKTTTNFKEWAYNLKDSTTGKTAIRKTITIGTTTIPYYVRGCTQGTGTAKVTQYDRLSRLKDAILPLLASSDLSNDVVMGLGQFSSKTDLKIGNVTTRLIDGHSGRIVVPNAALSNAQRIKIAQALAEIKSIDAVSDEDGTANSNLKLSSKTYPNIIKAASGTPTAHAYAEAAAYMMGTNTGGAATTSTTVNYIYDGYMLKQKGSEQVYFLCATSGGGTTSTLGATVKQCPSDWPEWDNTNKTVTGTLVLKPYNGSCTQETGANVGWCKVSYNDFKTAVGGGMTVLWDAYKKLPVGWRFDGWVKVPSEPLDIEPVVGTVWPYPDSINGLVSYRTNPFSLDGTNDNLVGGFAYSSADSIRGANYIAGGSTNTCDGNGIYFLTDGAPNSTKDTMARTIMNLSLSNNASYKFNAKPTGTDVLVSPTLKSDLFAGETGGWEYIGEYAKKLRNRITASDTQKNPKDMNIKTAVVGFGSSFAGISKNADGTYNCASAPNDDAKNACLWGSSAYGDGGFYYAENSSDIKNSIINFVKNVTPEFDPVATGSPTLPQDALNPLRVQPYGYYASFTPTPQKNTQLWAGNLNKYHVVDGELYSSDKAKQLIKTDGSFDTTAIGIWGANGMKGQLPLGFTTNTDNVSTANRTIWTNRKIEGTTTFTVAEDNSLNKVNVANLFDSNGTFSNDPQKNYWLNLLGYNVASTGTVTLADVMTKPELRQVGATMHSTPLLLTQSGKITVDSSGNLDTTDRDDYLLFGTTQGLLHVVHAGKSATDTDRGKEVFTFVPNEMMGDSSGTNNGQRDAFLADGGTSAGGSSSLFYGIDAPWTAYSQYISKTDGTLTVNDSGRKIKETDDGDDIALKGLQWVYGGLRMGGRSYYALDLSDIEKPSLKFHIDPVSQKIYNASGASSTKAALSYMGQSWSKPTIAYVNFGGVKKLVMFVGGGYDAGYEAADYDQGTTTGGGAGVYMFDANNGDLLWWTSANANAAKGAESYTPASNMQYSVVSQINAIDRDNDGLVDHLYFGDLGGQAFRVDLNNAAAGANASAKKANFVTRVVRLLNEHASSGASPRFYEMPSFSIHTGDNGYMGAVAFSSGNRSSPLSGATGTNQSGSTVSASDGVFVVYDKDVARTDLYDALPATGATALKTQDVALASLNSNWSTGVAVTGNKGWKYSYSTTNGRYKGMNGLYALDGILFVNVFDRDGDGINSSTCGGGVKGDSYVYQFCLPTGKCDFYSTSTTEPNRAKLGGGILGTGLGQGSAASDLLRLTVNRNDLDCTEDANKNKPECQQFSTAAKIRQLRWYETR